MRKSKSGKANPNLGSFKGSIVLEIGRDNEGIVRGLYPVHSSTIYLAADRGVAHSGYVQVIDGKPLQFFEEGELLIITPEHINGPIPK